VKGNKEERAREKSKGNELAEKAKGRIGESHKAQSLTRFSVRGNWRIESKSGNSNLFLSSTDCNSL
jgi:hypothetical protein